MAFRLIPLAIVAAVLDGAINRQRKGRELTMIDENKAVDRDGNRDGNGNGAHKRNPSQKRKAITAKNRPETGWQAVVAKIMEEAGKPGWVPKPSKRELLMRKRAADEAKLWHLTDQVKKMVLAGFNFKGGAGKTPMNAYLANQLSHVTGVATAFIDGNPASTSPGLRMGMYGSDRAVPRWAKVEPPLPGMFRGTASTWDVFQAIEHGEVTNGRELRNLMKQNHYGVYTLVAPQRRHISEESMLEMVRAVVGFVSNEFPFTFIDTGNYFTSESQRELARMSTDVFFPAYVRSIGALHDLPQTLDELSDPEFGDKVSRSIVVMTGIEPSEDARSSYGHHIGGEHSVTNIMGVPYDWFIEFENEVRLDLIRPDTRDALMNVLIAIIEQNLKAQGNLAPNEPASLGGPITTE